MEEKNKVLHFLDEIWNWSNKNAANFNAWIANGTWFALTFMPFAKAESWSQHTFVNSSTIKFNEIKYSKKLLIRDRWQCQQVQSSQNNRR